MNLQNPKNMKNPKSPKNKERLDTYLVSKGYFDSKNQAQAAVLAGNIKVNNEIITKAGTLIRSDTDIEIEVKHIPYVSRGGFKIEKAVSEFNIKIENKICLDIGASTGGFTDFLIQKGAAKVYSVDVGYGQLAWKLRQDERVIVIERTNIRNAINSDIYKDIDCNKKEMYARLAVVDVSFISITKILENIKSLMNPEEQELVLLIKPQFEAGKEDVPKTGVIKDKKIHFNVIKRITDFACETGFVSVNLTYSPIRGPAGNIEFLIHLKTKCNCGKIDRIKFEKLILKVVDKAHEHFNQS